MRTFLKVLLLSGVLAIQAASAADIPTTNPPDNDMDRARALVARKDWVSAQALLEGYVRAKPQSADGFNLLGYSYRNLKKYDESLVAYKQALRLDPRHRGAHEYIGMAYVEMGQIDKAREHLASLDKICVFSCEEFRDLKKAIEEAGRR
jgi:cytochrome c-type biogenesis protein CcmH/NrfG